MASLLRAAFIICASFCHVESKVECLENNSLSYFVLFSFLIRAFGLRFLGRQYTRARILRANRKVACAASWPFRVVA